MAQNDISLILGGTRSGKSRYAESLVHAAGGHPVYVATAEPRDGEMTARIARHRLRRGDDWITAEAPLDLVEALARHGAPDRPILIDCLTLWLSNLLEARRDPDVEGARLIDALRASPGPVVAVSNEVGMGIVPDNALARAFRDHAGRLNQAVAQAAGRVVLVAAGLPLSLKDTADG